MSDKRRAAAQRDKRPFVQMAAWIRSGVHKLRSQRAYLLLRGRINARTSLAKKHLNLR
ncbi:hypothetical protein [Tateyamaria pelophila]|uniref:hypothetical protein n=1 Tax=Tateyamaria pelophila TaxID=328415 RepID=UPI001CC0F524|nr:hypothetical protein [Tateyamaria pelophila]